MPVWRDPKHRPNVFVPELNVAVPQRLIERFQPLVHVHVTLSECAVTASALETELRGRFLQDGSVPELVTELGELTPDQIRNVLAGVRATGPEPVTLLWPYDGYCVGMPYAAVVQFYDDLWNPSSDDLWVTDRLASWLLIIDHEERLEFYR